MCTSDNTDNSVVDMLRRITEDLRYDLGATFFFEDGAECSTKNLSEILRYDEYIAVDRVRVQARSYWFPEDKYRLVRRYVTSEKPTLREALEQVEFEIMLLEAGIDQV